MQPNQSRSRNSNKQTNNNKKARLDKGEGRPTLGLVGDSNTTERLSGANLAPRPTPDSSDCSLSNSRAMASKSACVTKNARRFFGVSRHKRTEAAVDARFGSSMCS